MAGSRRKFRYESDSGQVFSLTLDESNGEAVNSASARLTTDLAGGELNKPQDLSPRYVLAYVTANPSIRRKFYVGEPDVVASLVNGANTITAPVYPVAGDTTVPGVPWTVTYYRGERLRANAASTAPDTGLTDGDTPG